MPLKPCPKCGKKNAVARKACSSPTCKHTFFELRRTANFGLTDALSENKENVIPMKHDSDVIGYTKSSRPIKRTPFFSMHINSQTNKVFRFLYALPKHPKTIKRKELLPQAPSKSIKWTIPYPDDVKNINNIKRKERYYFDRISPRSRIKMDNALIKINRIITKRQPS